LRIPSSCSKNASLDDRQGGGRPSAPSAENQFDFFTPIQILFIRNSKGKILMKPYSFILINLSRQPLIGVMSHERTSHLHIAENLAIVGL